MSRRDRVTAFGAGVALLPALAAVWLLVDWATSTGLRIVCHCGYDTGPMRTTRRSVAEVRWRWHRLAHRVHRA